LASNPAVWRRQAGERALAQVLARLLRQFQVVSNPVETGVRFNLLEERLADRPGKIAVQQLDHGSEFQHVAGEGIDRLRVKSGSGMGARPFIPKKLLYGNIAEANTREEL
jgi:hypothetical protein